MLLDPLFKHAREQPQHLAIVDDRGRYTYEQLAAMVSGLGFFLSLQTRQPRIGILLPGSAGFVASFYGTLAAGKSVVPINFLLGEREIAHIIRDSGIDTILTAPPLSARLEPFKASGLKIIDISALPSPPPGMRAPLLAAPGESEPAVLMYTSGTSGLPKGVLLTYGNLHSDVHSAISHAELQGTHKFLGILPLFHSTGLLATVIAPITLGASVVYLARFSPVGTLNAIREHDISIVAAVPSMYGAMARLKNAGPDDVKGLYAAISGGEPLPAAVRDAFGQKFGIPIYEGYGLTETIGPIAFNVPGAIRPGSVGRLIPGAEVRIADDAGNALPAGQTGEVWLRGSMIMSGYHNLPEETAAVLTPDGFFKSGDLGFVDHDGYLHITGRKKELIIVAGEKASPREIEDVLLSDPSVAEAAVLGRKDPSRGEVVVAFVTAREGFTVKPDELRDYCRQKGLMQWKIPREIRVLSELPHSPTGKVLKRVLAEQLAAEDVAASAKA
jgi:long-chain acyl-CoA synthetase